MSDGVTGKVRMMSTAGLDLSDLLSDPRTAERAIGRREVKLDRAAIADSIRGRRVLITGAAGSVGSALSAYVASLGVAELTLLDSHEPSLFHLRSGLLPMFSGVSFRWSLADVRDERKVAALFRETTPEIVFHLAAYKHVPLGEENVDQVLAVNVFGTLGLIRQAEAVGTRAFIYPSTDKAVNPPSIYGATKRTVEKYVAERLARATTSVRVVRLVNVFGTQGSVVETFARQAVAGQPLTITDSRMTRYWMTMGEAVSLLARAVSARPRPGVMMIEVGTAQPLVDFARRLAELVAPGQDITIRETGIRPGERLHEELSYSHEESEPADDPGLAWVIDRRPNKPGDTDAAIEDLNRGLFEIPRAELRARLFELASR